MVPAIPINYKVEGSALELVRVGFFPHGKFRLFSVGGRGIQNILVCKYCHGASWESWFECLVLPLSCRDWASWYHCISHDAQQSLLMVRRAGCIIGVLGQSTSWEDIVWLESLVHRGEGGHGEIRLRLHEAPWQHTQTEMFSSLDEIVRFGGIYFIFYKMITFSMDT